jgi:CheY-like chemotaxis protein
MKILVVEDNRVSAKLLEVDLKKAGYEVELAKSGPTALEYLKGGAEVGLIIMDVRMPEMSGLELLRVLKSSDAYKKIPVIMTTGVADAETVQEAVRMGCHYYLLKPFNSDVLLRKVRETLASDKAVLRSKQQMMNQLGLDEPAYNTVLREFSHLLGAKIVELEKTPPESVQPALEVCCRELHEGASVLGAERLIDILDDCSPSGAGTQRPDASAVLKEMKALQGTLPLSPVS